MEVIKHGTLRRLAAPACMLALAAGAAVCGAAAYGPGFWPGAAVWAGGFTASPGAGMKAAQALAGRRTTSTARAGRSTGKAVFFRRRRKAWASAGAGQQAETACLAQKHTARRRKHCAKRPPACGGRVRRAAG